MRILLDQGTPAPLRDALGGHSVETAYELGWSKLSNGELLAAAEAAAFGLLITTDQNLRYQQNLSGRRLAILVKCGMRKPKHELGEPKLINPERGTFQSRIADCRMRNGSLSPNS